MRKLLALLFILFALYANAQQQVVEVQPSTDKVIIEGKVYYIHIVKQGETLYSISKAYNISQKEIALENPDVYFGLKVDQALKIPAKPKEQEDYKLQQGDKFIYHFLEEGETLYRVAKKYDVSVDDILQYNMGIDVNDLAVGQMIMVPKNRMVVVHEEFVSEDKYFIYHKVKPKETLFSLSRQYKVDRKLIRQANNNFENGIRIGDIIRIPKPELVQDETQNIEEMLVDQQETGDNFRSIELGRCENMQKDYRGEVIKIGLLLPLYLNELKQGREESIMASADSLLNALESEQLDVEKKEKESFTISRKTQRFLQFYEGVLVAIDTLKKQGINIELRVYDTANDTVATKQLITNGYLYGLDLIIGPVYENNIKLVSEFASENNIPLVNPLLSLVPLVSANEFMFQITPPIDLQINQFVETLSGSYTKNIVFINSRDSSEMATVDYYKSQLLKRFSRDTMLSEIQFKDVVYNDSLSSLEHALIADTLNIVVVPSNNQAFVSDIVTGLYTLSSLGYDIELYGFSRWLRYGNIDPEYFFKLKLKMFTPYYIDYKRDDVKSFIRSYRAQYYSEPNQYAYQGFDIAYYFVSAVKMYGNRFRKCINNVGISGLQSDYYFLKHDNGGYVNNKVYFMKLDNYEVVPVHINKN